MLLPLCDAISSKAQLGTLVHAANLIGRVDLLLARETLFASFSLSPYLLTQFGSRPLRGVCQGGIFDLIALARRS